MPDDYTPCDNKKCIDYNTRYEAKCGVWARNLKKNCTSKNFIPLVLSNKQNIDNYFKELCKVRDRYASN